MTDDGEIDIFGEVQSVRIKEIRWDARPCDLDDRSEAIANHNDDREKQEKSLFALDHGIAKLNKPAFCQRRLQIWTNKGLFLK